MLKIGIELNGIVRDINSQYLKYYTKDINQTFDDTNIDTNVVNLIDKLQFKSKKEKEQFIYEDYPYELFGCANSMSRNLHTFINGWAYDLYWRENMDDISYFSLGEDELTIQSTYFYLSKSGSRVRNIYFPREEKDVWDKYDIVVTTNGNIVKNKPLGKIVVLILKTDNEKFKEFADYSYDNLEEMLKDEKFVNNIITKKETIFSWLKNKVKNIFVNGKR